MPMLAICARPISALTLAALLSAAGGACAQSAGADHSGSGVTAANPAALLPADPIPFDISSRPLGQALLEFSRQSGLAVLVSSASDLEHASPALRGKMPARAALALLLQDSAFGFRAVDGEGLAIVPLSVAAVADPVEPLAQVLEQKPYLEEVEVVASKRRTNLQRTPMTVTAVDKDTLEVRHIDSLFDLAALVPSLRVARNGDHTASMLYLRGIGSDNYTEAGDSGVVTHVDGIYSSRAQGSSVMLYDLDRVEVLRGPQGTLFGRNSTGGVINYHSVRPQDTFSSDVDVTLGSQQRQRASAMINLPLTDDWALRWAGVSDRSDGLSDYAPGSVPAEASRRYNNTDLLSHRLSSSWQAAEDLHWWASIERFADRGSGSLPVADYRTPVLVDTPGVTDLVQESYRSRLQWLVGDGVSLTYIAGYSSMQRSQDWDGDRGGAVGSETDPAVFHQSNRTLWSDHSSRQHELQLKSSDRGRLRWLLAYFDFAESTGIRFDLEHQTSDGSGWGGAPAHSFQQPDRGSRLSAFYGQLDLQLADHWQLSAGARSGRDKRFDRGGRNIACPDLIRSDRGGEIGLVAVNRESAAPGQCFVASYNDVSQSWDSTTHMARLAYQPADNALLYLLHAEGFKPGIVEDGASLAGVFSGPEDPAFEAALAEVIAINNSDDPRQRAYVEPEISQNLELGFKLGLLDGAMTLNGALFNTRYRDLQVSGVAVDKDGTEVVNSTNAASATINGLELEINWAASLNGRMTGFVSLLDAHYDKFLGVDNDFPRYGQTWNPSANNAAIPDLMDFSGNQLKQAPELSVGLDYSYRHSIGNTLQLTSRLGVHYTSRVYFDEANRGSRGGSLLDNRTGQWVPDPEGAANAIDYQPAYWRFDAGVKLEPRGRNWWLELYGRNLTDELVRYDVQTPELAQPEFYLAPPRTLELQMGYRFD